MKKWKVGIIGCGSICGNYLRYAKEAFSDYYEVVALADIVEEKARQKAEKHEIPHAYTVEQMLDDPDIDLVINLTVPNVHEEVIIHALEKGKHVYTEKPFATTREGCKHIVETATRLGKRVGCAPDSFMSAPAQTAKKAIGDGWIGDVIGVNCICPLRGNEYWRPDCDFFYKEGAGPMLDMAAYYLNFLVNLLGPVSEVSSMGKITFPTRTVKVAPCRGHVIPVEVPTYVTTNFRFANGVIGNFTNSFDIWKSQTPYIEIYGTQGTMILPDPNRYVGDVLVYRMYDTEWRPLQQFSEYAKYGRGIGVVDMIRCYEAGIEHKANMQLATHVTDIILSVNESLKSGQPVKINTTVDPIAGLWEMQDPILWQ